MFLHNDAANAKIGGKTVGLRIFPKIKFIADREKWLVEVCRNKTVLHLGCGDAIHFNERVQTDRHLHLLINSVAKKLCGVDINQTVIERLRTEHSLSNLYVADVEKLNVDFCMEFDVIYAGKIKEHINNLGLFLNS